MWTLQWTDEVWFVGLHYFQKAVYDAYHIGIPDSIWTFFDHVNIAVLLMHNM